MFVVVYIGNYCHKTWAVRTFIFFVTHQGFNKPLQVLTNLQAMEIWFLPNFVLLHMLDLDA